MLTRHRLSEIDTRGIIDDGIWKGKEDMTLDADIKSR